MGVAIPVPTKVWHSLIVRQINEREKEMKNRWGDRIERDERSERKRESERVG